MKNNKNGKKISFFAKFRGILQINQYFNLALSSLAQVGITGNTLHDSYKLNIS